MSQSKLPSERVMLHLPGDLASFVDKLAVQIAPPGISLNRQDAIRISLGKLKAQMETDATLAPVPAKKTARRK
jgi:hypothetical protein